ncbi:MAG: hypothetical protein AUJ49_04430 [Desulfovibrionaceae bacterium CG1_02_65_16]|nr:MAG: hypothetical protein AUJ49_04430 [Desulfovibrionaceae bacterium CG1_02_65_16]
MCLAVPAEIIHLNNGVATCRVGGSQSTIRASLMLLSENPAIGDYLVIHAGFALRVMDFAEAEESLRLLRETVCDAQVSKAVSEHPGDAPIAAAFAESGKV